MATITLLGSSFNTTSGSHSVTATPAAGDLIVIVSAASGNTSLGSVTPTDDNSSGAYTVIQTAVQTSGTNQLAIYFRTALVTSAVSTIFTHNPGTSTGGGLAVFSVTGMTRAGASAERQDAIQNNATAGGTPTAALASAVLTANPVIGAVMNATNPASITPRSSPAYSEAVDTGWATPTIGVEIMFINSGETGSSIAWGGTSATQFGTIVVELDPTIPVSKSDSTAVSDSPTIAPLLDSVPVSESSAIGEIVSLVVVGDFSLFKSETVVVNESVTITFPTLPTTLQIVLDGINGTNGFVPGIKII